jgi:hypothetical protein
MGQQMPMDIPAMVFVIKSTVDKVEEGSIHYSMVFQEAKSDSAEQDLSALLQPIVGLVGKGVMTDRGVNTSTEMDMPAGLNPQMAGQLESVKNSMGEMAVALPVEAVGTGAKWKVTVVTDQGGISLKQVSEYTLVGLHDGIADLRVTVTQSADEQKVENDDLPPGVELTLKSLEGGGEGTTTVDLNWLTPVKGTADNKVTMNMSLVSPQMSGDMSQSIDVAYSIEGKLAEK